MSFRSAFVCLTQDECDPVVSSCFAGFPPGTDCLFIRYMNVLHDNIIKSRFNALMLYVHSAGLARIAWLFMCGSVFPYMAYSKEK